MESTATNRETGRARLRDALIAAARELTVAHGWKNVGMAQVARAAGVSRQTVYNEFDGRAGLAGALVLREVDRFVADVRTELFTRGADVHAAAHAAILHTLREAAGNPLVHEILAGPTAQADELLPFLTTRSGAVLTTAGAVIEEWAAQFVPDVEPPVLAQAADAIVRLTISHVMLPLASPEESATALADVFTRLLSFTPRPPM
ncbi:TetR family transcriptional regulator [Actinoplanes sp. L3-i22]|uniref:TetR family transcriptional regulator n=1 Tax=Actinoplanes sp. L3-i22 TaxID=2836373 RepID=UPI001C76258E|nr:TetR family transcriptional regulator [Actinoplanes sp. L3-i22]BCY12623.1 TetR family transcriptional regulator [Actinoplanes sp. L3-i22]